MRRPKNRYMGRYNKVKDNVINVEVIDNDNIIIEENEEDEEEKLELKEDDKLELKEDDKLELKEDDKLELKEDIDIVDIINNMEKKLVIQQDSIKKMIKTVKTIRKEYNKQVKVFNREIKLASKKKKDKNLPKRAPTDFNKPSTISKELADFLNVDEKILIARTEVTKRITTYIRENDLRDKNNKRIILPNKKLQRLFTKLDNDIIKEMIVSDVCDYPGIPRETVNNNGKEVQIVRVTDKQIGYTYFNLQKYLKHHFK